MLSSLVHQYFCRFRNVTLLKKGNHHRVFQKNIRYINQALFSVFNSTNTVFYSSRIFSRFVFLLRHFKVTKMSAIHHYTAGSQEPPLVEGKIRLYSMRFCPFAHRAHLVLKAKEVPFEPVYINLDKKPEWYLSKFPEGRVPALLFEGEFLYESLILADFVNEQFPDPPLYEKDQPLQKIKDKLLIEKFGKVQSFFYQVAMKDFEKSSYDGLLKALNEYELEILKRGTSFFGGDSPKMVDYMLWPWFERFSAIPLLVGNQYPNPVESYPSLKSWDTKMRCDKAVCNHLVSPEIHAKHFTLRKQGAEAFDGLL